MMKSLHLAEYYFVTRPYVVYMTWGLVKSSPIYQNETLKADDPIIYQLAVLTQQYLT